MPFQAINRCLMASVWWASDFRLSSLGLILVVRPRTTKVEARTAPATPRRHDTRDATYRHTTAVSAQCQWYSSG